MKSIGLFVLDSPNLKLKNKMDILPDEDIFPNDFSEKNLKRLSEKYKRASNLLLSFEIEQALERVMKDLPEDDKIIECFDRVISYLRKQEPVEPENQLKEI